MLARHVTARDCPKKPAVQARLGNRAGEGECVELWEQLEPGRGSQNEKYAEYGANWRVKHSVMCRRS